MCSKLRSIFDFLCCVSVGWKLISSSSPDSVVIGCQSSLDGLSLLSFFFHIPFFYFQVLIGFVLARLCDRKPWNRPASVIFVCKLKPIFLSKVPRRFAKFQLSWQWPSFSLHNKEMINVKLFQSPKALTTRFFRFRVTTKARNNFVLRSAMLARHTLESLCLKAWRNYSLLYPKQSITAWMDSRFCIGSTRERMHVVPRFLF